MTAVKVMSAATVVWRRGIKRLFVFPFIYMVCQWGWGWGWGVAYGSPDLNTHSFTITAIRGSPVSSVTA